MDEEVEVEVRLESLMLVFDLILSSSEMMVATTGCTYFPGLRSLSTQLSLTYIFILTVRWGSMIYNRLPSCLTNRDSQPNYCFFDKVKQS